jgi:hypothetical protein
MTCPHPPEKQDRNWTIWRRRLNGEKLTSIGAAFGISPERVRQITAKCDRKLRTVLRRDPFPNLTAHLRDELLGVEFVFSHKQRVPDDVKPNHLGIFPYRDDPNRDIYWWIKKEK